MKGMDDTVEVISVEEFGKEVTTGLKWEQGYKWDGTA